MFINLFKLKEIFFGIFFGIVSGGIGAILAVSYLELSSNNQTVEINTTGVFNELESGDYLITAFDALNCDIQELISINSAPQADFFLDEYE